MATLGQKNIKDVSAQSLLSSFAKQGNQKAQQLLSTNNSSALQNDNVAAKMRELGSQANTQAQAIYQQTKNKDIDMRNSQAMLNDVNNQLNAQQEPTIEEPQADFSFQDNYFQGALTNLQATRQAYEKQLEAQRKTLDSDLARLQKEQDKIMKEVDQETSPFRADFEKKERERLDVERNFFANQQLTNELEALLTQGNLLIQQRQGMPIHQQAQARLVNKTIEEVNARAGVIEAVMAARNNQIAQATTLIDRARDAMVADRQDRLAFLETKLSLNVNEKSVLDERSREIYQEQLNLVKQDLERAQTNADYIKGLMQNPETAQFMADAGVTLNDSPEQVNKKLADQSQRQKLENAKNEMVTAGYEFVPFPTPEDDVLTVSVGGKQLSFRRPSTELSAESIGGFTVLRDSTGKIVSTRANSTGATSSLSPGYSPGSTTTTGTGVDSQENFERAVQSILATPGLTKQQRQDVLTMLQSQGLEGAQRWYVANRFSAGQKEEFNQYSNGSAILANVSEQLAGTNITTGPYKNLLEVGKPWAAIKRDQEYADLFAQIEFAQAQIRKGFYGTAVTAAEAGTGERFLIGENDDLATVQTKVRAMSAMLQFTNDANSLRPLGVEVNIDDYLTWAEQVEPPQMQTGGDFDVFDSVVGSSESTPGYWSNLWGNTKSFVGSLFGQ